MSQKLVLITPVAGPVSADKPPSTGSPTQPFFAQVTFLEGGPPERPERPVDPGWGVEPPVDPGYGRPVLPPLPPSVDNTLPGGGAHPSHPIYRPDKPVPPGEKPPEHPGIWPPIDPPGGGAPGYILVWVPGYGYRWIKVGGPPDTKPEPPPSTAAPKH